MKTNTLSILRLIIPKNFRLRHKFQEKVKIMVLQAFDNIDVQEIQLLSTWEISVVGTTCMHLTTHIHLKTGGGTHAKKLRDRSTPKNFSPPAAGISEIFIRGGHESRISR